MRKSMRIQVFGPAERREKARAAQVRAEVQVRGLDLSTVGAGKPREEEGASKDKIEVESM